jgi:endonuclease/exonuclease/phosphatase (EEP) superfamily protein YafD
MPSRADASRRHRRLRLALSIVSLVAAAGTAVVYRVRPASLDPVTILPVWLWALAGLALSLPSLSKGTLAWGLAAAAAWGVVVGYFAEEPRFLLREPATMRGQGSGRELRLVTLNCWRGKPAAVEAALAQDPDIVLLQEIPPRAELQRLVSGHPGWALVAGPETAILVRGAAEAVMLPGADNAFMCAAWVTPGREPGPRPLLVMSVHLAVPQLRASAWLQSGWSGAMEARAHREAQMGEIRAALANAAGPTIVGGDFNAPAGDTLYGPLQPMLRDAFVEAGCGWPDTFPSPRPVSRIDRVWVNGSISLGAARTAGTRASNHCMVVVEFGLKGRE